MTPSSGPGLIVPAIFVRAKRPVGGGPCFLLPRANKRVLDRPKRRKEEKKLREIKHRTRINVSFWPKHREDLHATVSAATCRHPHPKLKPPEASGHSELVPAAPSLAPRRKEGFIKPRF